MIKRALLLIPAIVMVYSMNAGAQITPWLYWTLLPKEQMDEIVGEASGETAWNTIAEINAFNRERYDEEYTGNFFETQLIFQKLKKYGLEGIGGPN